MLVAGFQGVSTAKDVTTLGRGGSDTTAVALAAAVGAEVCEIYTDVPGRLQRRPPDRPRRAQAAGRLVRRDARDGGQRRRRAAAAQRRVRPQPRRPHPLPIELRGPPRYLCRLGAGDHGTPPHHRRHALHRRGPHHAQRRARHARRGRPRDHRAGRGERQHRHDHPERARGPGLERGHVVHGPDRRPAHRDGDADAARRRDGHGARQRREHGQGLDRRRRHADAPRRRGQGLHHARRARASTSR